MNVMHALTSAPQYPIDPSAMNEQMSHIMRAIDTIQAPIDRSSGVLGNEQTQKQEASVTIGKVEVKPEVTMTLDAILDFSNPDSARKLANMVLKLVDEALEDTAIEQKIRKIAKRAVVGQAR
jgi:hypothetical protein